VQCGALAVEGKGGSVGDGDDDGGAAVACRRRGMRQRGCAREMSIWPCRRADRGYGGRVLCVKVFVAVEVSGTRSARAPYKVDRAILGPLTGCR